MGRSFPGRSKLQSHTKAGVPFWTTTFGNGDDLAYFPNSHQYYLFYAGSSDPVQCSEQESYVYPVITPPRYENNIVSSKKCHRHQTVTSIILR
jgi:hypothetical protein